LKRIAAYGSLRFAVGLLLAASVGFAVADECPPSGKAFENAPQVAVVQVVELTLPSLVKNQPDSPAREAFPKGRAVVIEMLRGAKPARLDFQVQGRYCELEPPKLGEVLIFPLWGSDVRQQINCCSQVLTLGRGWRGWDGRTIPLRDKLRAGPRPIDWKDIEQFRWPRPPPLQ